MPAKPLTAEQSNDAKRLKMAFRNWQASRNLKNLPWSQEWATEHLGFGQSALNQYLNGKIPLNPDAASKFASLLGCTIEDFSPSIAREISSLVGGIQPGTAGWPFPGIERARFDNLSRDQQIEIQGVVRERIEIFEAALRKQKAA